MNIGEVLLEVVKALMPPKADDQDAQTRWRWVVFSALVLIGSGLSLHVAIADGYLPNISSGFALESEQKQMQKRVDVIATLSLEHEIRSKTLELCTERAPDRREDLNYDISKLQREYREVTGEWYQVPNCDKL